MAMQGGGFDGVRMCVESDLDEGEIVLCWPPFKSSIGPLPVCPFSFRSAVFHLQITTAVSV